MDRHHRQRWTLFNKLPRDNLGTGRRSVLHLCGCSSVGRARTRDSPCGLSRAWRAAGACKRLRGRARPRHATWRSGPRVRDSSSAPLRVCPCTPRPRDMVLVARDVRGPWPDHVQRDTTSDGMLAFGHSRSGAFGRDASTRNPRRVHASGVEIGRNDWAAPEPVTGWIRWGCSSTPGRAAALQAAGCRFEPCHLHQCNNASLTQWPECRPV